MDDYAVALDREAVTNYITKLEEALNAFDAMALAYVVAGVLDRSNSMFYMSVREKHHDALNAAIKSCTTRNRTVPVKR